MFSDPEKNISQLVVDPGYVVADLGSGAGNYSIALAKAVESTGTVYAIEVQQDLLTKLQLHAQQAGLKNIKTIWADFEDVNGSTLPTESVDRVVISNTLFQLPDKEGALKEAYRILKSGGKFLLVDWVDSFGGLGPQPEHIVPPNQGRKLSESAGFVFEKDIMAGEHHYGMIFKK